MALRHLCSLSLKGYVNYVRGSVQSDSSNVRSCFFPRKYVMTHGLTACIIVLNFDQGSVERQ
jgi:hypothetical protein